MRASDIDDEHLYVCLSCDYHMHVDQAGKVCPNCGVSLEEEE